MWLWSAYKDHWGSHTLNSVFSVPVICFHLLIASNILASILWFCKYHLDNLKVIFIRNQEFKARAIINVLTFLDNTNKICTMKTLIKSYDHDLILYLDNEIKPTKISVSIKIKPRLKITHQRRKRFHWAGPPRLQVKRVWIRVQTLAWGWPEFKGGSATYTTLEKSATASETQFHYL